MRFTLRDYQDTSLAALIREVDHDKNPLCVLPTGGGKSLVLAAFIKAVSPEPVLVLSHVRELLTQDAQALKRLAPDISQGFFSAGLKEKDARSQAVFGSVQSVFRSLDLFKTFRKYLLIDEAHLCPRKADAMYAAVFDHFAAARRVGFTATPSRMDSGSLIDGDDAWFDCIAHQVPPRELIDRGFLVPLSGVIPAQQANLEGVAKRGGEFVFEQAEQAVLRTLSLQDAIGSARELARGRKSWLVFAAGIEHAHKVLAELRAQKISAEAVTNETGADERVEVIEKFKAGEFRALVNVGVLTTGFDAPRTDCIISLRPTQSTVLWQQMLGRGMRPAAEKKDCLLLDYVGNLDRMGGVGVMLEPPRDLRALNPLDGKKPKRTKREPQSREDPQLFSVSTADPMLTGTLFSAVVNRLEFFTIKSKRYPGKNMLVANYDLQDEFGRAISARSFICLEYEGGALVHARRWFMKRDVPKERVPRDCSGGLLLARACRKPIEVQVRYDRNLQCFVVENEFFDQAPDQVPKVA